MVYGTNKMHAKKFQINESWSLQILKNMLQVVQEVGNIDAGVLIIGFRKKLFSLYATIIFLNSSVIFFW